MNYAAAALNLLLWAPFVLIIVGVIAAYIAGGLFAWRRHKESQ